MRACVLEFAGVGVCLFGVWAGALGFPLFEFKFLGKAELPKTYFPEAPISVSLT